MPKRVRMHVNPFSLYSLKERNEPLHLPAEVPLEVELGCGDGLFIVERAWRNPERYFVGIDIRESFIQPGRDRIDELGLDNAAIEVANLMIDLERLFPKERVRRFFINFPDPFFKRRQHNRRWLTTEAVQALVAALEPAGEIVYQSDVWEIAIEALTLFTLHQDLNNTRGEFSFYKERIVETKTTREIVCERQGRKIWRMRFVRVN